ncbi:unnamed protein product [Urochloa humidicola]
MAGQWRPFPLVTAPPSRWVWSGRSARLQRDRILAGSTAVSADADGRRCQPAITKILIHRKAVSLVCCNEATGCRRGRLRQKRCGGISVKFYSKMRSINCQCVFYKIFLVFYSQRQLFCIMSSLGTPIQLLGIMM